MKDSFILFDGLPISEQNQVYSSLSVKQYALDEIIFRQGEMGDSVFFIKEGRIKISMMSEEGREFVITYLRQGEFFGELAVLTDEPRSADAISVEPTTLLSMSQESFQQCLGLPNFSKVVMTVLARRLYTSSSKFSDLVLYNVYRNVLSILKELSTPQVIDGRKVEVIEKRPTHQEIAALVGSSREVITRTLKELQRNECIQIEGRRVILLPRG